MPATERKPHRNSPERAAMLADRAREQRRRVPRFTPVVSKPRLSTRGERGETWRTKRWTPARWHELSKSLSTHHWADCDLASRDAVCFLHNATRLQAHIERHPQDGCARAALARLTV